VLGLYRRWRRGRIARRPFPEAWRAHLDTHVAFARRLSPRERARLEGDVQAFVHEKHFEGAQGFMVDDRVKVVIAAAAARLVLGLDLSLYDRLTEIVVYGTDYTHQGMDGVVYGEAHTFGTVVLSWPAVLRGLENPGDGHDTALHEFAHVMDVADGAFDGTPNLHALDDYRPWAQVMERHFVALRRAGPRRRALLRQYGATNEAEFFAVATEAFFEKPEQMKARAPDLYAELVRFYRRDPAR
jgi:Mlc titration factor MtfA (ptsG expression regulator)